MIEFWLFADVKFCKLYPIHEVFTFFFLPDNFSIDIDFKFPRHVQSENQIRCYRRIKGALYTHPFKVDIHDPAFCSFFNSIVLPELDSGFYRNSWRFSPFYLSRLLTHIPLGLEPLKANYFHLLIKKITSKKLS